MRRIEDPRALKEVLARLSPEPLTPAQARLLLAGRGIRARQKVIEEAVWGPVRRRSLDGLPLTPQERAVMERWRRR